MLFRNRSPKKKRDGRQRLSKYVEGRDYVFAKVSNPKHLYSFQSHPRGLPATTVLVEFKNLPSLRKKMKDQKKYHTLLKYKVKQSSFVFESNLTTMLSKSVSKKGMEEEVVQSAPMNKKIRKAQKAKELQALIDLFPFSDSNGKPNEKLRKKRVNKEKARQKKKTQRWKKKFSRKKTEANPGRHYELRAQFSKTDVLLELQEYVLGFDSVPKKKVSDTQVGQLMRMVGVNVFIPRPYIVAKDIPHVRVKASSSRCTVDVMDKVISQNWNHRSNVQKLFCLVMLNCSESSFTKHIGSKLFLKQYINLLRSSDELEREYAQLIIEMIYKTGKESTKKRLSKIISNVISCFTSDIIQQTAYNAGTIIRSLLLIILKVPDICGDTCWRTILPLYWSSMGCFVRYHQELFKCILFFISQNHELVAPITHNLLRRWPRNSAFKQLSFLDQLFAIFLELVKRWDAKNSKNQGQALPSNEWYYLEEDKLYLEKNICDVFCRLCLCIVGNHYDVSQAALRVLDHPAVFFPYIISPDKIKTKTVTKTTTTTKTTKHGLADYERITNHFLPGVYKAFRRQVETHMYIEVRKTLDTLMGIMEKHWPVLCHQCVEEEEERILHEEKRKEQRELSTERLIQLSQEQHKKNEAVKKQMQLAITKNGTDITADTRGSLLSEWNVHDIQEKRKRTWSLWEEDGGQVPRNRRGTCPLSFEQVTQQHQRKNSLELIDDDTNDNINDKTVKKKVLTKKGSLKMEKILSPKQKKGDSLKSPEHNQVDSRKSGSNAVSPNSDLIFPKESQVYTIDGDRDSEDTLDGQKEDHYSNHVSSDESVVSTCSRMSESQSQSQSLYSELFVNGAELSQLSQISIDCSRIEVSQSFKGDNSSDDDLDLDSASKPDIDEDNSQQIFSAARDAQLALILGETSAEAEKGEEGFATQGVHRLSVADTRLSFPDTI